MSERTQIAVTAMKLDLETLAGLWVSAKLGHVTLKNTETGETIPQDLLVFCLAKEIKYRLGESAEYFMDQQDLEDELQDGCPMEAVEV